MVHSIAVSFVVDPIAFIDVAVNVRELAFAVCAIVFPLAFVASAIWPLLLTVTIPKTSNPFTTVRCSCFECVGRALFSSGIWVIGAIL
jgi:hypothetical protein